ncbi:MAG: FIST N-terminal domain-containing protein, partial [Campylobacterota bacterium]|nr:FIST N-terminal domain-containing protein [Campylobacterota bacterium]
IRKIILELLPNAVIIGSTTDGEILNDRVTTDKTVISCSVFEKSRLKAVYQDHLEDSFETGKAIADKVISSDTKLLITFADGLTTNGEEYLKGVESISGDIIVCGGLAGDAATFTNTSLICNEKVVLNGAVAVAIDSDSLYAYNDYHFGWQGIGPKMTITKSDKNRVYEIDNKIAYEVYKYYLGDESALKLPAIGIEFPMVKNINGINVARAILAKEDDGSLVFAGNLNEGDKVQFGFGNAQNILKNTAKYNRLHLNDAQSIFIYSCMARRRFLQDNSSTELKNFTRYNKPVSGFFTYGEFFTNSGCELLNQTMTVVALTEENSCSLNVNSNSTPVNYITVENETMVALSHLTDVTSKELENTNQNLQRKVDEQTKELQAKVLELEKATRAKADFLANMSHEIRTPLNAIIGFIDIVQDTIKDQESLDHLDIVKDSGDSLLTIINDILDFSKIESGNMTVENINFDLKKLLRDLGLLFYEKTKSKSIILKIHFDPNTPKVINSDPTRFKQIAMNLIGNAIKFTGRNGNVEMIVNYDKSNNNLKFSVKDSGVGIDTKNIDKIFKPFSQEDNTTTRKFGGTGLGLAISRDLVKLLGGKLEVESQLGVGSIFHFTIPIKEVDKDMEISKKKKSKNNKKFVGEILLVEDNHANQMFMKIVLKKLGLEFDIANDGLEAVEKFTLKKYDAILMDENMPNMNGIEATKKILEIESMVNVEHTPIIALTANALNTDRKRFLNAGMDEYLAKPLKTELLIEIFSKFLKER